MKTPEAIKKGLECCAKVSPEACYHCPYMVDCETFGSAGNNSRDALAYINHLEARVPKWISVKDRLPEDDVDVIVYAVSNNGGYTIVITFHTHKLYGLNIEGWAPPWQYFTSSYTITHWMPLPEPPKEE